MDGGPCCLAQPGEIYAVYLPNAGQVTVQLAPGTYTAKWFNAFTGEFIPFSATVNGPTSTSPKAPGWLDWALLLVKQSPNN